MFSSSSGIHFINTFLLRKYNVTKADSAAPVLWNCYLFREADESGCSLAISDSFDVLPAAFKCFQVFLGPIWWAKSWIPTREMVPSFQLFSDWHSNVSSNFLEPKRRGTLASFFFCWFNFGRRPTSDSPATFEAEKSALSSPLPLPLPQYCTVGWSVEFFCIR